MYKDLLNTVKTTYINEFKLLTMRLCLTMPHRYLINVTCLTKGLKIEFIIRISTEIDWSTCKNGHVFILPYRELRKDRFVAN